MSQDIDKELKEFREKQKKEYEEYLASPGYQKKMKRAQERKEKHKIFLIGLLDKFKKSSFEERWALIRKLGELSDELMEFYFLQQEIMSKLQKYTRSNHD